jgi:hypothetical protein
MHPGRDLARLGQLIICTAGRAGALTSPRPDARRRDTPGTFKPSGALAVNVGAIRNGSFSHEHYSSSPSKTLRAAMGCAVRATETHNATKRSIFAWWRCVFQAGPSNPQQGFVGADRAKVQRESLGLLEPFVSWQFNFIHPSARTSAGRPPPGRHPQSGVPTQAATAPSALGPFLWRPSPLIVRMMPAPSLRLGLSALFTARLRKLQPLWLGVQALKQRDGEIKQVFSVCLVQRAVMRSVVSILPDARSRARVALPARIDCREGMLGVAPRSPSGFLIVPARINLHTLPTRRTVSASPPADPSAFIGE